MVIDAGAAVSLVRLRTFLISLSIQNEGTYTMLTMITIFGVTLGPIDSHFPNEGYVIRLVPWTPLRSIAQIPES